MGTYLEADKRNQSETARDFQTPNNVAAYMISLIPAGCRYILEPTPGKGGVVELLLQAGYWVTAPADWYQMSKTQWFDCVVMNPPFSERTIFNLPADQKGTGMRACYEILGNCMGMSNSVIALLPWFAFIDADRRRKEMIRYGLRSVTTLPRKTFNYSRIQTAVFEFQNGYEGPTILKSFGDNVALPELF